MSRLRAAGRLLHAVAHGLHGVRIVLVGWRARSLESRRERIRWWSRKMLRVLGIELVVEGEAIGGGALLALNHVSWLDIMVVHAVRPEARFVSKADVKHWPVVSKLVDSANTLYLEREKKRDALRVVHVMRDALAAGDLVAVFPEGTTTTGHALLPFHANLLQAPIAAGVPVQPAALRYSAAGEAVSRAMDFTGETTILQSLWRTANGEGVVARIAFLPPLPTAGVERRELATRLRAAIDAALPAA